MGSVRSVYRILKGICDPHQEVKNHSQKCKFLVMIHFLRSGRCLYITPSTVRVERVSHSSLMCSYTHIHCKCAHPHLSHTRAHTYTRSQESTLSPLPAMLCRIPIQVLGGLLLTFCALDTLLVQACHPGSHLPRFPTFQGQHACGKEHEIQTPQTWIPAPDPDSCPIPAANSPGT